MPLDRTLFLGQLIRRPQRVVARPASSVRLATAIAKAVPHGPGGVIELGSGTGKITRALLQGSVAPNDLYAIEKQKDAAADLKSAFPDIHVHHCRAEKLAMVPKAPVRAVVSGLPIFSMPHAVQAQILHGVREVLQPGGVFVQFTYGPRPPIADCLRQAFALTWTKGARIWNTLPPARVYTFQFAGP